MNNPYKKIIILGCGAQCRYALDVFSITSQAVETVLDPIGEKSGQSVGGLVIGLFDRKKVQEQFIPGRHVVLIGISNNPLKKELYDLLKRFAEFTNAVHPASVISPKASLGRSVIINANAVIQPDATIGNGVMIHAGVIVEHDCRIGSFANLAPNVTLAGGVTVGEGTTIYSGAVVAPNVSIGSNTVVGAGSLVLEDLPESVLVYGAPARIISGKK